MTLRDSGSGGRGLVLGWLVGCTDPVAPVAPVAPVSTCEAAPSRGPGTTEWCTLPSGRRYLVYTPLAQGELPLVLDLHGGGGFDPPLTHSLLSGFAQVADDRAFVVAWPEGSLGGAEWTTCDYAGPNCPRAAGSVPGLTTDQVDDRAFLLAALDDLLATRSVDPLRVYATGLSSGGAMAEILACGAADRLAGIAPLSIGIDAAGQPKAVDNYALSGGCAPSRPLPVVQAHARQDQVVPFAEGEAAASFWRAADGCGPPSLREAFEFDGSEGGDDPAVCTAAACDGGVEVVSCEIDASAMADPTFGGHLIYAADDFANDVIVTPGAAAGPRLAEVIWDLLAP